MSVSARIAGIRLYLITGAAPKVAPIEAFLERAASGGVGMVQLREKNLDDAKLLEAARRFAAACRRLGIVFIVNDRADIARLAEADGVHLGQDDIPIVDARRIVGPDAIVGLSTHSQEQVDRAARSTADYIGVGPVWATPTKPGRPAAGLELVRYAAAHAVMPFFAIGGIDPANVGDVVRAGAARVSVLRWIEQADDPEAAARAVSSALPLSGDIEAPVVE